MRVQRCTDLQTFYGRVTPFLQQREAEHNVMLSIMGDLLRQPPSDSLAHYMGYVETDTGEIVAVAHYGGSRLFISCPAQGYESALGMLVNDAASPTIERLVVSLVPGISVPDLWFARTGRHLVIEKEMRAYCLDAVIPPSGVPGTMRWATPEDTATVGTQWTIQFYVDAFGAEPDPAIIASDMERFNPEGPYQLVFWEVDGQPVSMAGTVGRSPTGMRVGMVYTPVDQRGHGYASALVAALSQSILDSGLQFCTLNTDTHNSTANKIYLKMGYSPVCNYTLYDAKPIDEASG